MSCCKIDTLHSGPVRGAIQIIRNIPTYITFPPGHASRSDGNTQDNDTTHPAKWPKALLLLPEGHGIKLPNIQLLADTLSANLSCPAILPDLFGAHAFPITKPPNWDADAALEQFLAHNHPGTVNPILDEILHWIDQPVTQGGFGGVERLGGVGYCFGGRYVIRLLAQGRIKVGVVNHPSFFTMDEVRELAVNSDNCEERGGSHGSDTAAPGDARLRPVFSPLAIFAAEEDDILPEEKRRETEDVLKQTGATWSCRTFAQTGHGFTVRGDISNPAARFAKEAALRGAVEWFDAFL
ncbi:hypothetical protein EMPG_16883 [Blastomyces silverae]|uniref:Dienelactone hydrolase domain-containing protein n=1 Tax=Blastomyces silverae TaxID=2060906 RepID=A0A0H1B9G1_9EURO|nr:hypothetical protein EMPG_16883 [Blastomyces silverae]